MIAGDTSAGQPPVRNSPPPAAKRPNAATRSAGMRTISRPASGEVSAVTTQLVASTSPASRSVMAVIRTRK